MLELVPVSLKEANAFVARYHRHHKPVVGHKFSVAAAVNGEDVKMDFRKMPYQNNTFKVVVFDPPHLIHAGTGSWLASKYGILPPDWPAYLKQGFDECMRVLEPYGLLIFKWNEDQIKLSEILKVFSQKPLLGDQRGKTRWLVFIK